VRSEGYRRKEILDQIATARHASTPDVSVPDGRLDPRAVMMRLNSLLPRERTLVVDGGHHFEFSVAHLEVPDPTGFVFANEYFSVGCGLAAALGAAVARRERLTIYVVGDGGFMMNLGDLDTAVRYRLPMVVVVLDDGGFGSEIHYLRINGRPDATARYDNPSFAAVAQGLGAQGMAITSLEQLDKLPGLLSELHGPLVLDCKVSTEVRASWVDFLFVPSDETGRQ
jgi:acetolactate synthase I/II/III large subunit